MKTYFYASGKKNHYVKSQAEMIQNTLEGLDLRVYSSIEQTKAWGILETTKDRNMQNVALISLIDLIVIEASSEDPEISYLIAQAAINNKSVLCLYRRGKKRHTTLNHLAEKPELNFLTIKPYTQQNIETTLIKYLRNNKELNMQSNIPSIKYTLRITPRMEQYLDRISREKKTTKAKHLRAMIEKEIKNENYQTSQENKRGVSS